MSEYYSKSTIESFLTYGISSNCMLTPANVMTILNAIPAVDAERIVRCENCKHSYFASNRVNTNEDVCSKHKITVTPEWYCADGEKRDD